MFNRIQSHQSHDSTTENISLMYLTEQKNKSYTKDDQIVEIYETEYEMLNQFFKRLEIDLILVVGTQF